MNPKLKSSCFVLLIGLIAIVSCTDQGNTTQGSKQQVNAANQKPEKQTERANTSRITCPKCGFSKQEKLPTEVCVIRYTCQKCGVEMLPKNGDCCVYCSYGDHKCPSRQE